MKKRGFLIASFFLLFPLVSQSQTLPLFSKKYERVAGKPEVFTDFIQVCNTGASYNILVQNGDGNKNRVSSASIVINGIEIIKESGFNQKVDGIEKTISLQQENTLDVKIKSIPDSFITITIQCVANCLDVDIFSPENNATINKSKTIVKGDLQNAYGETGVTVINSTPSPRLGGEGWGEGALSSLAQVQGSNFAGVIPLQTGANTLTAIATDACGQKAVDSITINAESREEKIRLSAIPSSGVVSLQTGVLEVSFSASAYLENPVSNYFWDFDGDGTVDREGSDISSITFGYQQTGLYFPTVIVTDTKGNAYTETTIVNVLSREEMDRILKGKWEGMKEKLLHGGTEAALKYFVAGGRDRYRKTFIELGSNLGSIFSVITEIKLYTLKGQVAQCGAIRIEGGMPYSYPVTFVQDENGIWKIMGF